MSARVTVLTGGVGGAKLVAGLDAVLGPGNLTAIVNTGDDFRHFGLAISPDIDTLLYTLSGKANRALGWGADERNFLIASAMLDALGINSVRLLTNNPLKLEALAATGVRVVAREAHSFTPNGVNDKYLHTKADRFGHLLDF